MSKDRNWTAEINACESLEDLLALAREMAERLESQRDAAYEQVFYE